MSKRPFLGDGAAARSGELGAVESAPLPGMVRLWSWEAFAHGAGCVSYFRWRQAPFAQEQMHAGLIRRITGSMSAAARRRRLREENSHGAGGAWRDANAAIRSKVALVYDYEAKWLFEIHPQGADFHYPRFAFEYYSALRALGLDVDVVPVDAPLDGYSLIVVPPLPVVPADLAVRLARSGAQVVLGPRTGSKTRDLRIPTNLPPGALASVLPPRVWRVESMRPNVTERVRLADSQDASVDDGHARHWRDFIDGDALPRSTCGRVSPTATPRTCAAAHFITSRACSTMRSRCDSSSGSRKRPASRPCSSATAFA